MGEDRWHFSAPRESGPLCECIFASVASPAYFPYVAYTLLGITESVTQLFDACHRHPIRGGAKVFRKNSDSPHRLAMAVSPNQTIPERRNEMAAKKLSQPQFPFRVFYGHDADVVCTDPDYSGQLPFDDFPNLYLALQEKDAVLILGPGRTDAWVPQH